MHSRHSPTASTLTPSPSVTIRPYAPGDETAILETFNRVYDEADPEFAARPESLWRWRYLANPAGQRIQLAVDAEGQVLAQYAGIPQRARIEGERTTITQGVDSMTTSEARGLSRSTLFVRTGEAFARAHCGPVGEGDPFVWGFPVPAAHRIGERFLDYQTLRSQTALILEPGQARLPSAPLEAEETTTIDRDFTTLFRQSTNRFDVIADRTAEVLQWRYLDHPTHEYRVGTVRDPEAPSVAQLKGFAVYRRAPFLGRECGILCDWLALPDAHVPLLSWASSLAADDGDLPLVAILPPWCEEFRAFQDFGFRVRPTPLLLVGRSFDKRRDLRFWTNSWYYTLGDSDLC